MTTEQIRIGSRGSALAMAQAAMVQQAFRDAGHDVRIEIIETAGDRRAPDTAWGEGAFVSAIERALLEHRVDAAVHSAKDIPTDEDARLRIAAYLPRADPRDALVVGSGRPERCLEELPAGSRVGTDSPRRTGFLRARRPDLHFHELNGNVDTRLRRLDAGETDALILACAGLDRLGRADRITERFDPDVVPPAPGQGAIAVQIRADDRQLLDLCGGIDDAPTRVAVEAERAFLRASGGGCRSPIGAYAHLADGTLELVAGHARPDGSEVVLGRRTGATRAHLEVGRRLAEELAATARFRRTPVAAGRLPDGPGAPRVIVTRTADQARSLLPALRAAALDPILVPAIEVEPVPPGSRFDAIVASLPTYRWVVLTSSNGARALLGTARLLGISLRSSAFAAVGSATAAVLERDGLVVGFQPSEATGAALAAGLPIETGDRVAVLQGDLANGSVGAALRARGATVDEALAYRTREAPAASRPLLRAAFDAGAVAAVICTSGSTVRGLASLARDEQIDLETIPAVCIGAETARAAEQAGLRHVVAAKRPDPASIADATIAALATALQEIA